MLGRDAVLHYLRECASPHAHEQEGHMHLLTKTAAILAAGIFAIAQAQACPWSKSASAEDMTVADTLIAPDMDTDVSIATNDLSDEAIKKLTSSEDTVETPAD